MKGDNMTDEKHHQALILGLAEQFKPILEGSEQPVYVYLDESNKVCNKKFASLLGYKSPKEWASVQDSFTDAFVVPASQETLVSAYQTAMEKMAGSCVDVSWKKKDGKTVKTKVILVPLVFENHLFALHFIS